MTDLQHIDIDADAVFNPEDKNIQIELRTPGGIVASLLLPLDAGDEADPFMERLPDLFSEVADRLVEAVEARVAAAAGEGE